MATDVTNVPETNKDPRPHVSGTQVPKKFDSGRRATPAQGHCARSDLLRRLSCDRHTLENNYTKGRLHRAPGNSPGQSMPQSTCSERWWLSGSQCCYRANFYLTASLLCWLYSPNYLQVYPTERVVAGASLCAPCFLFHGYLSDCFGRLERNLLWWPPSVRTKQTETKQRYFIKQNIVLTSFAYLLSGTIGRSCWCRDHVRNRGCSAISPRMSLHSTFAWGRARTVGSVPVISSRLRVVAIH